jgi:hypothetical protein
MLAALEALASFLAHEPLTVDEVVEHLGTVSHDYSGNVLVAPHNPLFAEANVVRAIDPETRRPGEVPAHVQLTPVEAPAVETLVEAFGDYRRVRGRGKRAKPRALFSLETPQGVCKIVLIAELEKERAVRITLRRDPEL